MQCGFNVLACGTVHVWISNMMSSLLSGLAIYRYD